MSTNPPQREAYDNPPPFLGSWRRVYAAVLLYTFVLITSLYIVTRLLAG